VVNRCPSITPVCEAKTNMPFSGGGKASAGGAVDPTHAIPANVDQSVTCATGVMP